MKPLGIMSQKELKSALIRSIIIEHHNSKLLGSMGWGYDAPPSMYVARNNRIRLAKKYSQKYQPVSKLLFQRKLPNGKEWQGTKVLVSNPIHRWVNGVWLHIGCTVPLEHCREIKNV
jgi:hypothetical protein